MLTPNGTDVLLYQYQTKSMAYDEMVRHKKRTATNKYTLTHIIIIALTVPSLSSLQNTQTTVMIRTTTAMTSEYAMISSSFTTTDSYPSSDTRTEVSMGSFPSKKPGGGPLIKIQDKNVRYNIYNRRMTHNIIISLTNFNRYRYRKPI